jgi:hypothetical protein
MNDYSMQVTAFKMSIDSVARNIDSFENRDVFVDTLRLLFERLDAAEYWLNEEKKKEAAKNELGEQ